jgi:hypothetical protein
MPIYEVDGVSYDIPTDDPEVAKQKIREHLGVAPTPQPQETSSSLTPQQVDVGDAAILATPALAAVAPKIPGAVNTAYQTGKALAGPAASAAFDLGKTYVTKPGALVTDLALGAMGLPPVTAAEQSLKGVRGTFDVVKDLAQGQGQFAPKTASVTGPVAPFAGAAEAPTATQIAKSPMLSEMAARQGAGSVPGVASRVAQGAGSMLQGAGTLLNNATPAMSFAMPYQMAAAEQERIRANPNAPQYATTPYAQQYRGEYATQGAAGAANRRSAIGGQQYGGLSEAEQRILESDRLNMAIRLKAAKKVLGQ